VTITCTLASDHPRRWVLARIGEKLPRDVEDLTNGNPAGATPSPSGGGWTSPAQTVVLTLKDTYLKALALDKHQFSMTGVSLRGLTGFTTAELKVTT
jgi:hypothetical protein